MAQVQISNGGGVTSGVFTRPRYRVQGRPTWSGEWVDLDYLRVDSCTNSAAPTLPRARLTWLAGNLRHEDQAEFGIYHPRDLVDWYVRVVVLPQNNNPPLGSPQGPNAKPQPLVIGTYVIPEENVDLGGEGDAPLGNQELIAYGLEHLLDRRAVTSAYATNNGEKAFPVFVPPPFNERLRFGLGGVGNRSSQEITTNVNLGKTDGTGSAMPAKNVTAYVFASSGTTWTTKQIIEYLLAYHNDSEVTFTLGGQLDALESIPPRFEFTGATIYELLNRLIDRRRGLGWHVYVGGKAKEGEEAKAEIRVFTTIDEPVSLGSTFKLPANANKVNLNLKERGHEVGAANLAIDNLSRFGNVVIEGAPILVMFSVSIADETLQPAWTSAEATAYKAGAGDGSNAELNDQERATDKFAHVFTRFHIPPTWDWKAGGGEGGLGNKELVNISCNTDGSITFVGEVIKAAYRNWGHRLLNKLPLPKDQADPDFQLQRDYRDPFVVLFDDETGGWVYAHADPANCHLVNLDNAMGFELRPRINHLLAKTHWEPTIEGVPDPKPTQTQPRFNFQRMIATVAARTDQRLNVRVELPYKSSPGEPDAVKNAKVARLASRVLTISVPDAELWYCVPNTVVDVVAGKLKRKNKAASDLAAVPTSLLLRDDSDRLRQIGTLAKAWYGKTRAAITLTLGKFEMSYPIGAYVTAASDSWQYQPVNSVISEKIYTFGAELTTTIRTNFAELDPRAVRGREWEGL